MLILRFIWKWSLGNQSSLFQYVQSVNYHRKNILSFRRISFFAISGVRIFRLFCIGVFHCDLLCTDVRFCLRFSFCRRCVFGKSNINFFETYWSKISRKSLPIRLLVEILWKIFSPRGYLRCFSSNCRRRMR